MWNRMTAEIWTFQIHSSLPSFCYFLKRIIEIVMFVLHDILCNSFQSFFWIRRRRVKSRGLFVVLIHCDPFDWDNLDHFFPWFSHFLWKITIDVRIFWEWKIWGYVTLWCSITFTDGISVKNFKLIFNSDEFIDGNLFYGVISQFYFAKWKLLAWIVTAKRLSN